MRALLIDQKVIAKINIVRAYAEDHVFSTKDIEEISAGAKNPPGDDPNFVVHIERGFRVVYSQSIYPRLGRCHHISISVDTKGKFPNDFAVATIMELFGMEKVNFRQPNSEVILFLDKDNGAVNVIMSVKEKNSEEAKVQIN